MVSTSDGNGCLFLAWTAPWGGAHAYWPRPGRNRIGCAADNELVLKAEGVSRLHAELWLEDGRLRLRDLDSKNGTWVNGESVAGAGLLPGDAIEIGSVLLSVEEAEGSDGALAFHIGATPGEDGAGVELSGAETGAVPRSETSKTALAMLEAFADHLGPSPVPALAAVAEVLGAEGVTILTWHELEGRKPEPVVVAHSGKLDRRLVDSLPAPLPGAPAEPALTHHETEEADATLCRIHDPVRKRPLALMTVPALPVTERAADPGGSLRLLLRLFSCYWDREHIPRPTVRDERGLDYSDDYVPGTSAPARRLHAQLLSALQGDLPILLTGPTGAGKDALARLLHRSSPARERAFVAVNCAAIPPDLLEAELFGIEAGVATGVHRRTGRFREAAGGFLFLDEIGDLPLALQAKLLRVLETREVTPVGGAPAAVDVRIVAATNAELDRRLRDRSFRADLYYRLAGFLVEVPPLRDRREDIPALVESFARRSARRLGKEIPGVSVRAMRRLSEYDWPGNIRELRHEIDRLVCACAPGEPIHAGHLPARISESVYGEATDTSLPAQVAALERRLILEALRRTGGNQSEAARQLGVSRNGLRHRMARLELVDNGESS